MWLGIILSCLGPTSESCTTAINPMLFDSKEQCEEEIDTVREYLRNNVYFSQAGCMSVEKRGQKV